MANKVVVQVSVDNPEPRYTNIFYNGKKLRTVLDWRIVRQHLGDGNWAETLHLLFAVDVRLNRKDEGIRGFPVSPEQRDGVTGWWFAFNDYEIEEITGE